RSVKVLLDECVPRRLRRLLQSHEVKTVPEAGWAGVKNGQLLRNASGSFDVMITVDRNLSFQQDMSSLPVAVIIIHANTNKLKDLHSGSSSTFKTWIGQGCAPHRRVTRRCSINPV